MQPIQFFAARAEDGALLPNASVDVFVHGSQARAVLFSNSAGTVPLGNPFQADANARVFFYSSTDRIDIRISRYGYVAPMLLDISTVDVATAVEQVRWEIDQLLVQMKTEFDQLLLDAGYESVFLAYAAGVVVERPRQLVQRAGELFRVKDQSALPLTLSGTWATDEPKLMPVGDASLRQGLASLDGTSLIREPDGATLKAGLASIRSGMGRLQDGSATSQNNINQRVDMHYGVLHGVGFIESESGGLVSTVTTAAVSTDRFLPVANTASFLVGQLIVYQGANGEYYSGVVQSKDAANLALHSKLEQPVLVGAVVSNFYSDVSHPNDNGFKAIADFALRNLRKKTERVVSWVPSDGYSTQLAVTIGGVNGAVYENPGSVGRPALGITAGANLAGVVTLPFEIAGGNYVARVTLTPTLSGSVDQAVAASIAIRETVAGVGAPTIAAATATGGCPTCVEIAFCKRPNSTVQVVVTGASSGHQIALSKIEIVRVNSCVRSLDKGVHVWLGDSWFPMIVRLQERLPNAIFVNAGVGGNRSDQLRDRFATDVAPYKPVCVWAVAGTNDVAQGVDPEVYAYNMAIVSSMISEIGADGIFFNASVGAKVHPTLGDLLTRSRSYALAVAYLSESADRKVGFSSRVHIPVALTVPAGTTRRVGVLPGTTTLGATLNKLYVIGQSGATTGNVRFGFGGSAGAAISEDLQSVPLSTAIRQNLVVTKATAAERFLLIEVENPSGAAIDVVGFVTVTWTPL
ncbi:SGNH/GDSL hydrolase family protein [Pseudomonas simiae]